MSTSNRHVPMPSRESCGAHNCKGIKPVERNDAEPKDQHHSNIGSTPINTTTSTKSILKKRKGLAFQPFSKKHVEFHNQLLDAENTTSVVPRKYPHLTLPIFSTTAIDQKISLQDDITSSLYVLAPAAEEEMTLHLCALNTQIQYEDVTNCQLRISNLVMKEVEEEQESILENDVGYTSETRLSSPEIDCGSLDDYKLLNQEPPPSCMQDSDEKEEDDTEMEMVPQNSSSSNLSPSQSCSSLEVVDESEFVAMQTAPFSNCSGANQHLSPSQSSSSLENLQYETSGDIYLGSEVPPENIVSSNDEEENDHSFMSASTSSSCLLYLGGDDPAALLAAEEYPSGVMGEYNDEKENEQFYEYDVDSNTSAFSSFISAKSILEDATTEDPMAEDDNIIVSSFPVTTPTTSLSISSSTSSVIQISSQDHCMFQEETRTKDNTTTYGINTSAIPAHWLLCYCIAIKLAKYQHARKQLQQYYRKATWSSIIMSHISGFTVNSMSKYYAIRHAIQSLRKRDGSMGQVVQYGLYALYVVLFAKQFARLLPAGGLVVTRKSSPTLSI